MITRLPYFVVLAIYLGLAGARAALGRLTGDEGWYTLVAERVLRGEVLYRDFLFTQPPGAPYVYAGWFALTDVSLLSARLFSGLLGGLAVLLTMRAAERKAGIVAAWLAGLLLAANLSFVFDMVGVKTQPLTACLAALCLWALANEQARWGLPLALFSAAALTLTRLSMLPVLALTAAYALHAGERKRVIGLALAAVPLGLAFFPLDNLWFGLVEFHDNWYGYPSLSWRRVAGKLLPGIAENQGTLMLLFFGSVAAYVSPGRMPTALRSGLQGASGLLAFALACWVITSAIHVTRPVSFPTYQTSNMVFAVVFVACVGAELVRARPRARVPVWLVVAAAIVTGWPTQEYVLRANGDGSLAKIAEVTQALRSLAPSRSSVLFTLSAELAVESGLPLLPGWELSEFSWFPRMDEAEARRLRVSAPSMLMRDLSEQRPDVVALTDRHMHMLGPEVFKTMITRYEHRASIEAYGQFFEPLHLFTRRKSAR